MPPDAPRTMSRLDDLIAVSRTHRPPTVAVAMANDPEVIRCIGKAVAAGLVHFILIGPRDKILAVADANRVSVGDAEFIDESDDVRACATAAMMVCGGRVQILMKGLVQTSTFTRAFLAKELNLVPQGSLISHLAIMDIPAYHKLLLMTDGGINIDPDVPRKAAIMRNAIRFAQRIGIAHPKVALISAVETVNPKMRSTVDARELVRMAEEGLFGTAIVDGPFGLDIAISAAAARTKGATSEVAGDADILLMPNIEAGNVFYKALTQFSVIGVAGVLVGGRCPVIVTSRSDTEEVKFRALGLAVRSIADGAALVPAMLSPR
jgi:phosphate butyryltransferase